MATGPRLSFDTTVWLYAGKGGWHFVSLPVAESEEVRTVWGARQAAWGSLAVDATIGETTWQTSLFWDTKSDRYLLPLKAEVRKREAVHEGDDVHVELRLRQP